MRDLSRRLERLEDLQALTMPPVPSAARLHALASAFTEAEYASIREELRAALAHADEHRCEDVSGRGGRTWLVTVTWPFNHDEPSIFWMPMPEPEPAV